MNLQTILDVADNIAIELKLWRGRLGLTQQEVAVRIGVERSAYQKWESGKASPKRPEMQRLIELGFVELDRVREARAPYETTADQFSVLIETLFRVDSDPDIRAAARRELHRLLKIPDRSHEAKI